MSAATPPNDPEPTEPGERPAAESPQDAEPGRATAELVVPAAALEAALREREEALAQWKRAAADYQNLRRRAQSDQDAALRRALEPLLAELLLALDGLDLALAAVSSPAARGAEAAAREGGGALEAGVRLTREQIARALEAVDVRPIPAEPGQAFDPACHQAVAEVAPADTEARPPGTIHDAFRRGWSWRGAVLRPAQVRVVARPQASAQERPKEPAGAGAAGGADSDGSDAAGAGDSDLG
jgi:molecular chaperone GrpE